MTISPQKSTQVADGLRMVLDSRTPPPHVEDDKRDALRWQIINAVAAYSPDTDAKGWAVRVAEKIAVTVPGRVWPSIEVWEKAAQAVSDPNAGAGHDMGATDDDGDHPAPRSELSLREKSYRAFVRNVQGGLPASELHIFGQSAERALREGDISLGALRRYQAGAYRMRQKTYGKDSALRWLKREYPRLVPELHPAAAREIRPQHAADKGGDAC